MYKTDREVFSMTKMTEEELRALGRNEKIEFMKRWGYWPCSIMEFNQVSLYCVKLYFKNVSTKEIVACLKQQLEMDYEIFDIEKNFVHFHCLFANEGEIDELDYEISNRLREFETFETHWIG